MAKKKAAPSGAASVSEKSKPKRGRPKGAKTQEREVILEVPAQCPKCGVTEFRVLRTTSQREGTFYFNGQEFNLQTWRRIKCDGCGQVHIKRTFRLI